MAKKRFYLIANPKGGSQNVQEIIDQIRPIFEAADAELMIHATSWAKHASEIARNINIGDYTGLCTLGGDGTAHEVINGLLTRSDQQEIPLGIIPGGSGNSFLYGLGCRDPLDAVHRILRGHTQKIDVAKMTMPTEEMYSFNIIGWGLVTAVNHTSEKFRWWPQQRYNLATVIELIRMKTLATRLIVDGQEFNDPVSFLIACNTPYTGVGMKMAPLAQLDDGKIDLVLVKEASRLQMINLFSQVFEGKHIDSELVDYHQAERFELIPETDNVLDVDGEIIGTTPLKVAMVPKAISIYT